MREIKFRVWTGDKMQPCGVLPNLMSEGFTACVDSYSSIRRLDGFVMQFTGLKDKNDVEIYEGDIVKCSYRGVCWVEGVEVVGYNPVCGFSPIQKPVDYDNVHAESWHWEVVGNIYENPELLE